MPLESITDNTLIQNFLALGFFGLFLLTAVAVFLALKIVAGRLRSRAHSGLAHRIVSGLRNPAFLFIGLLGLYLGLRALPDLEDWENVINRTWTVLVVLLIGRAVANVVIAFLNWYIQVMAPRTKTQIDDKLLPIFRRFALVVIYGLVGLIALDTMGASITPLLGGLGITGLAIALALQPTLSNFFAGTYVVTDGAIQPGDYIELQGGPAGYVIEVGWRSTKIRTWLNNLVVVPNSIMADTIVTNYQAPDPTMNVLITCGVSYDSDLAKVEQVGLEVANEVREEISEAVKSMDPWFGFDQFGDSNIGFWIFLQAKDRIGSFVVTNELIKRLHARFAKEGIEINYPVRKLVFPDGANAAAADPSLRKQP